MTASLRRTPGSHPIPTGVLSSPERGTTARPGERVAQPTEPRYLRTPKSPSFLQVSPKTVSRWAQEGRLPYLRTLGGHRRYPDAEIRALLETLSEPSPVD